jgi:hypothetical protein
VAGAASAPVASEVSAASRFSVDVRRDEAGWSVVVVDPLEGQVLARACRDEAEARTFASTVRQHAEWLSEGRFRAYYRLGAEG